MILKRGTAIRPFATRGRRTLLAILTTFALFSALSVGLTLRATQRSRHQAAIVQVAARQRTLAERYVQEVLLARGGHPADPNYVASLLRRSAAALLDGGLAPPVNGDDDEHELPAATDTEVRAQLAQEQRLVADLTASGHALLTNGDVGAVRLTASERIATTTDPVQRVRVLAALTSNVSLNAARTFAVRADGHVDGLIALQIGLGIGGFVLAMLLGLALIAATRRQTAHFRSLVTSSTDLVLLFGRGGCRYASESVTSMVGRPAGEVIGDGFLDFVHPDDRGPVMTASTTGEPHQIEFLISDRFGEWRHLEANVTDLRGDRRVKGVVFNARDITERVGLEQELTHQAFHDALTGLANRALFHDRLDLALARTARSHEPLAVVLVDLDRFKHVNDTLGHGSGDELLRQFAQRLAAITRPSDTLARLGGDEFALLLDGASEQEALAATNRLLGELNHPVVIANRELVVDASAGVATHTRGAISAEELLRRADVAMYAAKRAGGGRAELFKAEMADELGRRLSLEQELRLGLQHSEFRVYYQPEIDLGSHAIVGVEALVRWHSSKRGLVGPDDFIPTAESTGLILAIGEFVLGEACRQTAEWCRANVVDEAFVMWVNVSGKQLSSGGVKDLVLRTLEAHGLAPERLGLEVTETAIVVEGPTGDRARAELDELHELGVHIAIDDFGTGFSSLGQLRRFPIDVIKVDRSFIQGMEHDPKSATITASLASLAHALGLVATAEGIETPRQLASARELGCDVAQGYLFARPAPADQVTKMLRSSTSELVGVTTAPSGRGPSPR